MDDELQIARDRVRTLEINIERLLDQVAEFQRPCKACAMKLWFVKSKAGKMMPLCYDGTTHFANCPSVEQFKRPEEK